MSVTTVRLNPDAERELASIADRTRRSKSWLINLLPRLVGPSAVFRLEAPVVETDETAADVPDRRPDASTHITLDSGRAEIELYAAEPLDSDSDAQPAEGQGKPSP